MGDIKFKSENRFGIKVMRNEILKIFLMSLLDYIIFISVTFSAQSGAYSIKTKVVQGIWDMIENCESRRWTFYDWGRDPTLTWGTFFGRNSLRISSPDTDNAIYVVTKSFPLENWQNIVELIRVDVYVEFPANSADLKFESKKKDNETIEAITISDILSHQWTDLEWDIDQGTVGYSEVKQIYLIPDGLGTNPATFYFDNMRLITTTGATYYWDVFEDSSGLWLYGGDGYAYDDNGYQTTETAITWTGSKSTVNSNRIYLKWDSAKDASSTEAKVESDLEYDLSQYVKVKMDVRCSTTNANIAIGFWNGSGGGWKSTGWQNVPVSDSWEVLEWDLPDARTSYYDAVKIIPIILNTDEVTTGEIYIDNIQFYK